MGQTAGVEEVRRQGLAVEPLPLRALTVIWSPAFVSMFLQVGLRSLLAPGNLPDLARRHRVTYTIYTTAEDAQAIEAAPAFQRLRETVDVRMSLFKAQEIDAAHYGSHGVLWQKGLELATRNREILFFLIPDMLYARGTLLRWAAQFEQGYRAIYTPGPQVALETVLPEIEQAVSPDGLQIDFDPANIPQFLARHLHPMHGGMLRDAARRVPFPEYDIRPVRGRGFILREITAQPFCLDPSYFGKIVNFSPVDRLKAVSVIPCTTLSVEPLFKRVEWYYRPWRLDGMRISQLGDWWNHFGPPGCVRDCETAHSFCLVDDAVWQKERRRAELGGRSWRAQLIVATQVFRLVTGFKALGLHQAAAFIASAVHVADFRRRVSVRAGATLFVPRDGALLDASGEPVPTLLEPGRERELIELMQDHALPAAADNRPIGARTTARGLPFAPLTTGVEVISGPHTIDSFTVYVIDRVLWRQRKLEHTEDIEPEVPAVPASTRLSSIMSTLFGTWGYSAWATRSRVRKVFYLGLHVPILEPLLALLVPLYFRRDLYELARWAYHKVRAIPRLVLRFALSNTSRRICLAVEPLPVVGSAARQLRRVAEKTQVLGIRRTVRLVLLRTRWGGSVLKLWRAFAAARALAVTAARYLRRNGVRATWRRAIQFLRKRYPSRKRASKFEVPQEMLALFNDVRRVRVLQAAEDILQAYEDAALSSTTIRSAPLSLVRDLLIRNGFASDLCVAQLESTLAFLVERYPNWAEAWLELGYLKLDHNGPADDVLACFARAAAGKPFGVDDRYLDPRAEAQTILARLLQQHGRTAEAADHYAASLSAARDQRAAASEFAQILRRRGQYGLALHHFDEALSYEEPRWQVPSMGRDARNLLISKLPRPPAPPAPSMGGAVIDTVAA